MPTLHNEFIPWTPWYTPISKAKVALVSTGGVYLKKGLHQPYASGDDPSFREFPAVVAGDDLEVAAGRDDGQARADVNVLFPLERLQQLAGGGYIGAVAPLVYSFKGAVTDVLPLLANYAPSVAYRIRRMGADVALVVAAARSHTETAGLIARAIELAGVPTLVLAAGREAVQQVGAPRSVLLNYTDGAPLGNPGNGGKHQHMLREALAAGWEFEGPGMVAELDLG